MHKIITKWTFSPVLFYCYGLWGLSFGLLGLGNLLLEPVEHDLSPQCYIDHVINGDNAIRQMDLQTPPLR